MMKSLIGSGTRQSGISSRSCTCAGTDASPTQEVDGLRSLVTGIALATAATVEYDILYFRITKTARDTQLPDIEAMGM
jgi:hypothetical protein